MIAVLLLESLLALLAGRPEELDRLLGPAPLEDETQEALEAVEPWRRRATDAAMIAIVFLLVLLAVAVFAAANGGQAVPIGEILVLIGVFLVFFGSGVYIAAVLGAARRADRADLLRPALLGFSARCSGGRRPASCWSRCRCSC